MHHLEIPVLLGRERTEQISNKSPFDNKKEIIAPPQKHLKNDFNASKDGFLTNSVNSVDGHSVGDLPEFILSSKLHKKKSGEKIVAFVRSKEFQHWGLIILTLCICYIVAMRVEVLGINSDNFDDLSNTWHLNGDMLFWLEVSLLSVIIIFETIVSLPWFTNVNLVTIMAGIFDIVLTSVCLGLLIWAEITRCNTPPSEECPDFGTRSNGGVGLIEPFTFLISLRFLKYNFASFFERANGEEQNIGSEPKNSRLSSIIVSVRGEDFPICSSDEETRSSFYRQKGTVNDLWKIAIQVFPDISHKYGKFSSELFQAMLFGSDKIFPQTKTSDDVEKSNLVVNNDPPSIILTELDRGDDSIVSSRSLPKGFDNLNKDAQRVILNGTFGETQEQGCTRSRNDSWNGSNTNLATLATDKMENREVDTDLYANSLNTFLFADSNLIRSMRRCERQFLPLFDEWETVDVVMTRHEIVWFATTSEDESIWNEDKVEISESHKTSILDALTSTNGGNGLRLSDVAYGRNVLGSLKISDIDNIKLKRFVLKSEEESATVENNTFMGSFAVNIPHDLEHGDCIHNEIVEEEYWRPHAYNDNNNNEVGYGVNRWDQMSEDRLIFHSTVNNCTLNLRFMVDLANEKNVASKRHIVKRVEGAGLWCPTIARLCGPQQLKQKCTHLGDGSEGELEDFIEIHYVNNHRGTATRKLKPMLKRTFSHIFDKHDLQQLHGENVDNNDTVLKASNHSSLLRF